MAIAKALANEQRRRILMALRGRELCEGVIAEMLALTPSTVSRHLWILRQAGLVESDKAGRCVCYRVTAERSSLVAARTLRWLEDCLAVQPQMVEDARRAGKLCGSSPVQADCGKRRERLARRRAELVGLADARAR